MPLREFRCTKGHTFEALVKMDGSDEPTKCQHEGWERTGTGKDILVGCSCSVERIMSVNAKSFPGADSWRR